MSKMMFAIDPPSTSSASQSLGWLSEERPSFGQVEISDILPVLFPRKGKHDTVRTPAGRVSGRRDEFLAHVLIDSPSVNAMYINAGLGQTEYIWLDHGRREATRLKTVGPALRQRSSEFEASAFDAWTSEYYGPSALELTQILSSIQAVLTAIESRTEVALSPEAELLLDRALQRRGTPRDIDQWARQIADDVGGDPE